MLKNPAYKGTAAYGKTRAGARRPALRPQRGAKEQPRRSYSTYGVSKDQWTFMPVPAIVREELFEAVQQTLEDNRRRNRRSARGARHLLQGLVVCAKCGYSYYGKPVSRASAKGGTRTYVYYRCVGTDAYRFGDRGTNIEATIGVGTHGDVHTDGRTILSPVNTCASRSGRS